MPSDAPGAARIKPSWAPALAIGALLVLASVVLWLAQRSEEAERARASVDAYALAVAGEVQRGLGERMRALERMAVRWELRGGTPEPEWREEARAYMDDYPGFQSIGWVDPTFHVRWIEPQEGNEAALGFHLASEERRRLTLERARDLRRLMVTQAIDLVQGGRGLIGYVPLYSEGRFQGMMGGVCRFNEALASLLPPGTRARFAVGLWEGAEQVVGERPGDDRYWSRVAAVRLPGATWRLRLGARPELMRQMRSDLPELALLGGLLVAMLLMATVRLRSVTRARAEEAERARASLEAEIERRGQAERRLALLAEGLEARVAERTRELEESRTEALRLERELAEAQKLEALGHLAGGVAHDFNNSLMAITGLSELAAAGLDEGHPSRGLLAQLTGTAERSARLTGQILAFGRRQVLRPEHLDLARVARESAEMLGRVVGEGVELRVEVPEEPAWAEVDAGQLEQLLLNLALNASQAMGGKGRLTLRVARVGESAVRLEVEDTGPGMDEATRARVFEPFFTTKGDGHGLGLAMVHGFVTQSGGRIEVRSAPGEGTVMCVHLPAAGPRPEPRPDAADTREATGPERAHDGRATVLVAEDDEMVRKVVAATLERAGFRVLTASDGVKGVELIDARGDEVDLLLTDVLMPRLGGPELAAHVARVRPELPVVFMSGYTAQRLDQDGLLPPGVTFLQKPVGGMSLVEAIREAMGGAGPGPPAA